MFESEAQQILLIQETSAVNQSKCLNDYEQSENLYVNLSTFWYGFLALITIVGLLVSLVSNSIIIYLFTSTPSLRNNPSNIIAVNLSLSDLLYCTQWPSVIYCSLTQSTWILEHKFVCQSFGFITVSTALASILTVLVMSVERAIVIKYSIQAKSRFTIRLACLIIVLIWIISLCSCLPPLFGKFNRYTLDPSKTSCTLDYLSKQTNHKLYILVLYVAFWIAPAIIITISYILIVATFKKSSLSLRELANDQQLHSVSSISSHRKHSIITASSNESASESTAIKQPKLDRKTTRTRGNALVSDNSDNIQLPSTWRRSFKVRRASASFVELSRLQEMETSLMVHENEKERQITRCELNNAKRCLMNELPNLERTHTPLSATTKVNPAAAALVTDIQSPEMVNVNWASGAKDSGSRLRRGFKGRGRDSIRSCQITGFNETKPARDEFHTSLCRILNRSLILRFRTNKFSEGTGTMSEAARSQLTRRTVMQYRLAEMSFYLILLWLVSWTPIASLAMLNSVLECHRASATAVFMASTMTKLGPALDVFIYGISHPKIKSKFKQIIKCIVTLGRG